MNKLRNLNWNMAIEKLTANVICNILDSHYCFFAVLDNYVGIFDTLFISLITFIVRIKIS